MLSVLIGSIVFLAMVALVLKVARNNSQLVQPIAQFFGIICVSLVFVGLVIG